MKKKFFSILLGILAVSFCVISMHAFADEKTEKMFSKEIVDQFKKDYSEGKKVVERMIEELENGSGVFVGIGIQFKPEKAKKDAIYVPRVIEVVKNMPAEKAGVQEGDIVESVNGKMPKSGEEIINEIRGDKKPGREVTLTLFRDGKKIVATMKTVVVRGDKSAEAKTLKETILKEFSPVDTKVQKAFDSQNGEKILQAVTEYYDWINGKYEKVDNLLNP